MGAMWCSGMVFLCVCCRVATAEHEGRRKKSTPIRGLICSDYKWLPSVRWRGRTSCPVLRSGSKHHVNIRRRFFCFPRPEAQSSGPGTAGQSDAAESLHCAPKKTQLLTLSKSWIEMLEEINWWCLHCIVSVSGSERIFGTYMDLHVETTWGVLKGVMFSISLLQCFLVHLKHN